MPDRPHSSRRERRAAWRATRAFLDGGAIAVRKRAIDAGLTAAKEGKSFTDAYWEARLAAEAAGPHHAQRTADWRRMWADPRAGYRVGP